MPMADWIPDTLALCGGIRTPRLLAESIRARGARVCRRSPRALPRISVRGMLGGGSRRVLLWPLSRTLAISRVWSFGAHHPMSYLNAALLPLYIAWHSSRYLAPVRR